MAIIYQKQFYWDSLEGWLFVPAGDTVGTWVSGTLQSILTGRKNNDTFYWYWEGTWESLGLEPNSTVNSITLNSLVYQRADFNTVTSVTVGPVTLANSSNVDQGTLWVGDTTATADPSQINVPTQSALAVPVALDSTSDIIRIVIKGEIVLANSGSATATTWLYQCGFDIDYNPSKQFESVVETVTLTDLLTPVQFFRTSIGPDSLAITDSIETAQTYSHTYSDTISLVEYTTAAITDFYKLADGTDFLQDGADFLQDGIESISDFHEIIVESLSITDEFSTVRTEVGYRDIVDTLPLTDYMDAHINWDLFLEDTLTVWGQASGATAHVLEISDTILVPPKYATFTASTSDLPASVTNIPVTVQVSPSSGISNTDLSAVFNTYTDKEYWKKLHITDGEGNTLQAEINNPDDWSGLLSPKYPSVFDSTTVKATSYASSPPDYDFPPHLAFDPSLDIEASYLDNCWTATSSTNQKYNVDLGSSVVLGKIELVNATNEGNWGISLIDNGVKDFSVYGTNSSTAFNNTTYADTTDLTFLGSFQGKEWIYTAEGGPLGQFYIENNTTPFRYYVLRIANNWGGSLIRFRRVVFFQQEDSIVKLNVKLPVGSDTVDPIIKVDYTPTNTPRNIVGGSYTNVKTFSLYVVSDWEGVVRSIKGVEFFKDGVLIPFSGLAYSNSDYTYYRAEDAFNTPIDKTWSSFTLDYSQWNGGNLLFAVFTTPIEFDEVRITNGIWSGDSNAGVRRVQIGISSEVILDTDLYSHMSKVTQILDGEIRPYDRYASPIEYTLPLEIFDGNIGAVGSDPGTLVYDSNTVTSLSLNKSPLVAKYTGSPFLDSSNNRLIPEPVLDTGMIESDVVSSPYGVSYSLNGVDANVNFNSELTSTSEWTFEAFVKPLSFSDGDGVVVADGDGIVFSNGKIASLDGDNVSQVGSSVVLDSYIHIAVTSSGLLYENGVEVGTPATDTAWGTSGIFKVGVGKAGNYSNIEANYITRHDSVRSEEWLKAKALSSFDTLFTADLIEVPLEQLITNSTTILIDTLTLTDITSGASLLSVEESITFADDTQVWRGLKSLIEDTLSLSDDTQVWADRIAPIEDTISFSDSENTVIHKKSVLADTLSFTSDVSGLVWKKTVILDSVTFSEEHQVITHFKSDISDSINATDTYDSIGEYKAIVSDTYSITDSVETIVHKSIAIEDTLSYSDNIQATIAYKYNLLDNLTLSDQPSVLAGFTENVEDTFIFFEELTPVGTFNRGVGDSATFTDEYSFLQGNVFNADDTLTTLDQVVLNAHYNISISEDLSLLDNVTGLGSYLIVAESTLTVSDIVDSAITRIATFSDSLSISDQYTTVAYLFLDHSESFVLSDLVEIGIAKEVSFTDDLTFSDSGVQVASYFTDIESLLTLSDLALSNTAYTVIVSDLITLSEDNSTKVSRVLVISDDINISEGGATSASLLTEIIDSSVVTDLLTTLFKGNASLIETLLVSDSIHSNTVSNLIDSIGLSDQSWNIQHSIADEANYLNLIDTSAALLRAKENGADTLGLLDVVSAIVHESERALNEVDNLNLTDLVRLGIIVSVVDSLTIEESIGVHKTLLAFSSDLLTLTDILLVVTTRAVNVEDLIEIADSYVTDISSRLVDNLVFTEQFVLFNYYRKIHGTYVHLDIEDTIISIDASSPPIYVAVEDIVIDLEV